MKNINKLISLSVLIVLISGCQSFILKTVMQTVDPYFHGEGIDGSEFTKISNNVYTYRWNWYRNIIINTSDGLVIIDPMNPAMAFDLKKQLDIEFPNHKVHTLIYSHYHLDHSRGGEIFKPKML